MKITIINTKGDLINSDWARFSGTTGEDIIIQVGKGERVNIGFPGDDLADSVGKETNVF